MKRSKLWGSIALSSSLAFLAAGVPTMASADEAAPRGRVARGNRAPGGVRDALRLPERAPRQQQAASRARPEGALSSAFRRAAQPSALQAPRAPQFANRREPAVAPSPRAASGSLAGFLRNGSSGRIALPRGNAAQPSVQHVSPTRTPASRSGDMSALLGGSRAGTTIGGRGQIATPRGNNREGLSALLRRGQNPVATPNAAVQRSALPSSRVVAPSRVANGAGTRAVGSRRDGLGFGGGRIATPSGSLVSGGVALPTRRTAGTVGAAFGSRRSHGGGGIVATPSRHIDPSGASHRVFATPSRRIGGSFGSHGHHGFHRSHHHRGHDFGFYVVNVSLGASLYDWCYEPVFGYGTVYYETLPSYIVAAPQPYWQEGVIVGEPQFAGPVQPHGGEVFPPAAEPAAPSAAPAEETTLETRLFNRGVEAFMAGRHAEAEVVFEMLSREHPESGQAWMGLMHARFALGDYTRSAEALREAAQLGAFPRGYRFDPVALYPDESLPGRLAGLEAVVRAPEGADADTWLMQAYFLVALGQEAEADAALRVVLGLRPTDATAIILRDALLPPLPADEEQQPWSEGVVPPAGE